MNQLSFRRYTRGSEQDLENGEPEGDMDLIVPLIDGNTVAEIVGWDGVLAGLPSHYVEPTAQQWGGPPSYGDDGRTAIIDGDCGVVGCCGVQADVTFTETTVRWSHFTIGTGQPDNREYEFDRGAYEAALNSIASLTSLPLDLTT